MRRKLYEVATQEYSSTLKGKYDRTHIKVMSCAEHRRDPAVQQSQCQAVRPGPAVVKSIVARDYTPTTHQSLKHVQLSWQRPDVVQQILCGRCYCCCERLLCQLPVLLLMP